MEDLNSAALGTEFPFELIRKELHPTYIYRFPENDALCHRFSINTTKGSIYSLICNGCRIAHSHRTDEKKSCKCSRSLKLRKAHGNSMETDPSLDHREGCKPFEYSEIAKVYEHVIEDKSKEPDKYGFPVEKMAKTDTYSMVHRIKDDPTKSFKFLWRKISIYGALRMYCSRCHTIGKKMKVVTPIYDLTEDGFSEDPCLGHLPGCEPHLYGELMLSHTLVNKDSAIQMIRDWRNRKEVTTSIASQHSNAVETTNTNELGMFFLVPGLAVVEPKMNPTYFYRIPNSEKCFRFNFSMQTKRNITLRCHTCYREYTRLHTQKRHQGYTISLRPSDGFSMKEDPLLNHSVGCDPEDFSQVVKMYRDIDEEPRPKGEFNFPLIRMRKVGIFNVLHRIEHDSTLCYVFNNCRKTMSSWMIASCYTCDTIESRMIREKKKSADKDITTFNGGCRKRITENGFLEDPLTGHYPDCKPLNYANVMTTKEFVDKATAATFINGTYKSPAIEFTKTDFPALVIQKKNANAFVVQVPFSKYHSYLFHQLNHGDNSQLFCTTCLPIGVLEPDFESNIAIRKSDGFSMETDPIINHSEECRGQLNREIWRGMHYSRSNGEDNCNRKYAFSIEKRAKREKYSCIYVLKDDPALCYRFNSATHVPKSGYIIVQCHQCTVIAASIRSKAKSAKIPNQSKVTVKVHRCTAQGFLEDPTLHHVVGCEPLKFSELMREYAMSAEEESDDFFKHIYNDAHSNGVDWARRAAPKKRFTVKTENDEVHDQFVDFDTSFAVKTENESKPEPFDPDTKNDIFSHVFDVPFFNEDEVSVITKGRTVTLEFERKVSAVGIQSCYLRYSVDLPESIDISTVQTTMEDGQMILTADRNH